MTKKPKDTTPAEPVAAEVEVAPRTPKPISFPASGEVRQVKAGTKLALLIDLLARPEGASIAELSEGLSRTGSPVDAAGVRSWISFDLKRTGLGIVQPDDRLHLVGDPLPHKVAEPKNAPEMKKVVEESEAAPKLKKAAGSGKPKRDRKAERERRALKLAGAAK